MLVVRRGEGQSIVIAGDVQIEVLEIASNKVKLGIVAPKNVSVLRGEVKLIMENNLVAKKITSYVQIEIANKVSKFVQTGKSRVDKTFEQDTSGIRKLRRT